MKSTVRLDTDWKFHYGDEEGADFMGWDDRAWESVQLPHDWAVTFPFDRAWASGTGYLPGGTAWYRKHFTLEKLEEGAEYVLHFQGIHRHCRVYLNSYYLGSHAYGYTSFSFQVGDMLKEGENVIAVYVEHKDVADSRWYTGSGITRHVELECRGAEGIDRQQVRVETVELRDGEALIRVHVDTTREGGDLALRVLDGESVVQEGAGKATWSMTLDMTVKEARLWSPVDPHLYTLEVAQEDGQEVTRIPFGIRTAVFDPDQGFFLNGENLKIRGVCVHHDAGALGAAVPKSVWRYRLEKLKAAGVNAIRTAHNPADPDLLDLCDEMGFLVMEEAFDEWEGCKNKWWQGHNVYPPKHHGYAEDFPQWHERDLMSMVRRDRNRPSIIMWSIGNEVDYPNDPYVTPLFHETLGNNDANKPQQERIYDPRKPDAKRLVKVAEKLVRITTMMDPTRPVLSAMSFPELSNQTGFADVLTMSGYNYREHFYDDDHKSFPDRVIIGSENSHDPACWKAVLDRDFISGQFLWTGIDFLGECRGWPVRISQAGMLDLCGYEKPLYALRSAMWRKEASVRIAVGSGEKPNPWDERFAWAGDEGETKTVSVYTNESSVELFLNGRSLGRKELEEKDLWRLTWQVPFEAGTLVARGSSGVEDRLVTSGAPAELSLKAWEPERTCREDGTYLLEVTLLDGEGRICTEHDIPVRAQLVGDGEIIGIENGQPDDLTPYRSRTRSTFRGRQMIYVRRTGAGDISVCLSAESIPTASAQLL
ncbi:MAG: DUF4982 domain-containing protein [Clostridia bacterium]|nr:DUF4982 domain-containing protein [Clostridia bacterium]